MKQFLLLTAYLVTTLTSFGQQGNVFHHSKQDRLHQRDNERSIIPSKQGNNLLAPSDLGSPPAVNWVKQFGGDGADIGQDIVTDASGNSYVTGYFSGPVSFGGTTLTSVGYTDAFVAKFNNTGSLLWIKQLSCNSYEMVKGFGIALDNAGHVFVTGFFNGVILHAGTVTLSKTGNEDLFIVKISPEGNISMGAHYGVPG
ncbi:MAG: SBBP repeat-containing protein, partial [Bacteroidales bacterium]|nr:SBBP repeat-containing protein [Bacteroidales bacterium]